MATTIQDLVDQRQAAWAQAQEYNTRKSNDEPFTAEDEAAWQRALDDVDRLGTEIENLKRTADLESRLAQVDEQTRQDAAAAARAGEPVAPGHDAEYARAFDSFLRHGISAMRAEEREVLQRGFVQDQDTRALGAATGSAGGYAVPEGFWAKVTETLKYFGGAAEGAELITTTSGNPLPWPTNDDTSSTGYILGENTQASNEGDLSFGQKQLGAYTFVSGPGLVSLQLLQDSGVDIESLVARKMGERLGRIQNTRFTTGTGSSQPQGNVYGATTGKTTASATAITPQEIIDLVHSVDAAYRATGRCSFKLHDLILAYVRKLKDESGGSGYGRPLWEPSIQAGMPDTLFGYPVVVNNDMDSAVTTGKKTILFGDHQSHFVVRRVNGGSVMRLTERYADYLQVGFIAYERADALVQDSSAAKLLVQA